MKLVKGLVVPPVTVALEGKRDVVIHAFSHRWRMKAAFVGRTVRRAAEAHGIEGRQRLRELGEAVTASLVAADCKGEERVVVNMLGEGKEVYSEALPAVGEVRAYYLEGAEHEGPGLTRMSRITYGAAEASSSTVAGRGARELLRAQGLAALLFGEEGGVVMEQSADVPLEQANRDALQDRLDAFGPPRAAETPSEYVARLVGDEEVHVSRIWTAFHCRCVLPQNATTFAKKGEVLTCKFCSKGHFVP